MNSEISQRDHLKYAVLQVAATKFGSSLAKLNQDEREQAENIARNQLEIQSRMLAAPEASQVVIPPERIEKEVQTIISRYANEEDFHQELVNNELTEEQFQQAVARELRVEAILDLVASSAELCSENDARLYYYLHPEKFDQPETRKVRHILITINPDYPENEREQAHSRAKQVAARLMKKPARFAEQAMKNSECPTAMNGGELGRVKRGALFPTLDNALFSMKPGEVSEVIESPMGFHVLFCEEVFPKGSVPVTEAIPIVLEKLNERNRKNHQRKWIKKICSASAK